MLPWMEGKRKDVSVYEDDFEGPSKEGPKRETDVHSIALRGVAHELINALKEGSVEKVSTALDLLCEICIAMYDKD